MKKENTNMRNRNGLKEALRGEVEKCHGIIAKLRKDNEELRRNWKEQNFDVDKKTAENERKIGKAKS